MDRELKFRAWDTLTKEMYPHDQLCSPSRNGTLLTFRDFLAFPTNGVIVMQFTGIRDKNGREVYEGDIINAPSWWWGPCAVELRIGHVGPATGDNVMEWGLVKSDGSKCYNLWNGAEVEVIGNIYTDSFLR